MSKHARGRKGKYSQSNCLKQSRGSPDGNVPGGSFLIEQGCDERGKSLSSKDQCTKRRGALIRDGFSELYERRNSISLDRKGELGSNRDV